MIKVNIRLVFFFCFSVCSVHGQDTLALKDCLRKAHENNMNFLVEQNSIELKQLDMKFHQWSWLPSVSAYSGLNTSFGRRLDPITNTFGTSMIYSNSYGLSANATLFNGLSYLNQKRNFHFSNRLLELDVETKKDNLSRDITNLYVELCLAQLNLNLTLQSLNHLNEIKSLQIELLKGGRITHLDTLRTANTIYGVESKKDEIFQTYVLKSSQLNFLIGEDIQKRFSFDMNSIAPDQIEIHNQELFAVQKNEIEIERLANELKSIKHSLIPSLTLSGSLGTGFSSNNKDYSSPDAPIIDFNTQLSRNLYENVGVQLSIPIFGKGEYLKKVQTNLISAGYAVDNIEYLTQQVHLKKLEYQLSLERTTTSRDRVLLSVANYEVIYKASMEEYKAGKITYNDLQTSFMDWQTSQLNLQLIQLELLQIKVMGEGYLRN